MTKLTSELIVDILEVAVAAGILLGYIFVVLIQNQSIQNPVVEGLVVVAGLVMFGDQYQEHLAG